MTKDEIKTLRESLGLTITQLSAAMGCTRKTIYRWESGEHPISKPMEKLLLAIAKERAEGGRPPASDSAAPRQLTNSQDE